MKKITKDLQLLIWSVISAITMIIAYSSFVFKGNFFPGGFSGISRLIVLLANDYFDLQLSYSIIYFSFNAILAIIVFKYIGKRFTFYSLIEVALFSYFVDKFPIVIDIEDRLLLSIFGGVINGLSCGLALSHNISNGGTDFLSVFLSDRFHKSAWNLILVINILVLSVSGYFYGWETAMYSMIFQYVSNQMIQSMHHRYTHQTLSIITTKPDDVTQAILSDYRHGITEIKAVGAYKHADETMLYIVVNSFQTRGIIKQALKADPKAFINIQDSRGIVGNYYQLPLD